MYREIGRELFAAITDLEGSLIKDLTAEAVKTGVSFIPVICPFLGPRASLLQAVADGVQDRRSLRFGWLLPLHGEQRTPGLPLSQEGGI